MGPVPFYPSPLAAVSLSPGCFIDHCWLSLLLVPATPRLSPPVAAAKVVPRLSPSSEDRCQVCSFHCRLSSPLSRSPEQDRRQVCSCRRRRRAELLLPRSPVPKLYSRSKPLRVEFKSKSFCFLCFVFFFAIRRDKVCVSDHCPFVCSTTAGSPHLAISELVHALTHSLSSSFLVWFYSHLLCRRVGILHLWVLGIVAALLCSFALRLAWGAKSTVAPRSKPPSTPRIQEERDRARNARRAWGAILKTRRWCQVCKIRFSSEVNGLAHYRGKQHAKAKELAQGPYRCSDCARDFPRKNELDQHVLSKAHVRKQLELAAAKKHQ